MHRRALLGALLPFRTETRRRRPRDCPTVQIIDHTSPGWQPLIEEAIAIINALLPPWHPTLSYVRAETLPGVRRRQDCAVFISEAAVLSTPTRVGETWSSLRRVYGHRSFILLKANPQPANRYLVIHELFHALARTKGQEHGEWTTWDIPFDTTQIPNYSRKKKGKKRQ